VLPFKTLTFIASCKCVMSITFRILLRKPAFIAAILLPFLTFLLCSLNVSGANRSRFFLPGKVTIKQADGKGAFVTKKYRNLFKENGHTAKEIDHKVNSAFRQLFYGRKQQRIYFPAGTNSNGPLAYIFDAFNNDIRSEGMSYGMMIAVQLNKKAVFDALWNYAMTKMYIGERSHPAYGYFAWSLKADGTPNAAGPAPDGEEYLVMDLYFAAGRWGNGKGVYHYSGWAAQILSNMRHHPLTTGPTLFGIQTAGSVVSEAHKMILFAPNGNWGSFSDPSYHLPAFYELWARCGPKADRAFWAAAADTSRNYFGKAADPVTGLSADYADFAGTPVVTNFNANADKFAYDSWRTAMNWSIDWSWWQKDEREQERSNVLQAFFAAQGISSYGSIYTLAGKQISSEHSAGLVAANAVASLAATRSLAKDFVEALWNLPVPESAGERYYGGLLYLMGLLHCRGQFQIYIAR
jgi:oligosaccharide reducing-end xylanase